MTKETSFQPAPEFALTDLNGEPIEYSSGHDRPLLLNFFVSTCSWCQVEMPKLAEVYERMDKIDVAVIGIACGNDTVETAREFAAAKDLNFPIAVDADLPQAFNLERVPAVVLIDEDGYIARVYQGSSEQLSGIVEQTLLAAAGDEDLPDFQFIGNGCAATVD